MRRGARSIRGALGAYVWASAALVVALALVLVLRPDAPRGTPVELVDDGTLLGATLEADALVTPIELSPGATVLVPPGTYRVRVFRVDGGVREALREVGGQPVRLDG